MWNTLAFKKHFLFFWSENIVSRDEFVMCDVYEQIGLRKLFNLEVCHCEYDLRRVLRIISTF